MEADGKRDPKVQKEEVVATGNRGPDVPLAELEPDIAATYNAFKEFEGRRYTGVKIGRGHKWYTTKGCGRSAR